MRFLSGRSWRSLRSCPSFRGDGCWAGTRGFPVSRGNEMWRFLGTYEARIKIFLILLVFFLASAITVNFCLLMMSRDAVRDEIGQRIILVAEAAKVELGLSEGILGGETQAGTGSPASQVRLARLAKEHSLAEAELLDPQGIILSSSM